jgi:hypothetical protein
MACCSLFVDDTHVNKVIHLLPIDDNARNSISDTASGSSRFIDFKLKILIQEYLGQCYTMPRPLRARPVSAIFGSAGTLP